MLDKEKLGFDPDTCPLSVLEQKIEEYKEKEDYWNTMQLSAKRFINSVYGVFGSAFFNLANTDIAESITLQGQNLIKYSVVAINKYFSDTWQNDIEGHKKIAEWMKNKYPDFDTDSFLKMSATNSLKMNTLQVYGDTDSAYITLEPLVKLCGIKPEHEIDFCLAVHSCVLEKYLDHMFDEYAKAFHCNENLEKFELEKVSRTIIMLAKKNYMCDVAWIDSNIYFKPLSHITYTGFDVVKGVTTNYCREELKNFVNFVFDRANNGSLPAMGDIVQKLREMKKRFSMQNPNEISKTVGLSNYENFIKNDKGKGVEYYDWDEKNAKKLACPIHVRAAAVYNNYLYTKGKKYMGKYDTLKSGDKVRFYYTTPDDVFGFIPDDFPMEFAPPVDVDTQFEKCLLSPINRIISAIGYSEVPVNLTYSAPLF